MHVYSRVWAVVAPGPHTAEIINVIDCGLRKRVQKSSEQAFVFGIAYALALEDVHVSPSIHNSIWSRLEVQERSKMSSRGIESDGFSLKLDGFHTDIPTETVCILTYPLPGPSDLPLSEHIIYANQFSKREER